MLRRQAEMLVLEKTPLENIDNISQKEVTQMLHELRVHQIELEMQNEELRLAQEALDASHARYLDLYDFAPTGYITLSEKGLILKTNLTAATLLGKARSELVNQPFSGSILKQDQEIYYLHRKLLFESSEPQRCELRMVKKDGATFWAQLDAIAVTDSAGAPTCRMVVSDITERKKAGELLLEKERLQGVLEMAGAICHEMSQPLQVISGFSSILLMDMEESDPLYKPIKGIEAGIIKADRLIKKIMGITRYQSKPYLKINIVDIEKASQHEK
ncbi:MAG: PAS domain S-box protein [Proteobacteria bacterium]|nr:PAS domain S-box protein [Pseudomonadota bacterium]